MDGPRGPWLVGWAFDPAAPERRLKVLAEEPGRPSVAALADRYRADVQAAGHPDGCCGFALRVASPVTGAARPTSCSARRSCCG